MPYAKTEWFDLWFNSPYYHILYKNRNEKEAQNFIDKLTVYLGMNQRHKVMDLACGKGRHAIYLNSKGFDVEGIDLSEKNIRHAQQFGNARLHFKRHDMRQVYRYHTFDYVLNMFTSFGYFDSERENIQAIQAVAKSLKPQGRLILDFLNTQRAISELQPVSEFQSENITFHIKRFVQTPYIIKDITVNDQEQNYHFQEKVMALEKKHFLHYFEKSGLEALHIFGDYHLNPYDAQLSERMIFVASLSA